MSSRSLAFSAFPTMPSSSIVALWTITASWPDAIPLGLAPASGMCVSVSHPSTASEWLMAHTWLYFERMSRTRGFLASCERLGRAGWPKRAFFAGPGHGLTEDRGGRGAIIDDLQAILGNTLP